MLWYYREVLCWCFPLVTVLCFLSAWVAYRANLRRENNDPDKKEFEFNALWLAPLTWPFLLPLALVVIALRAIVGFLLIGLFALGVLVIRKPFFIAWLEKIALKIGNQLMLVNSFLIRAMLGKPLNVVR